LLSKSRETIAFWSCSASSELFSVAVSKFRASDELFSLASRSSSDSRVHFASSSSRVRANSASLFSKCDDSSFTLSPRYSCSQPIFRNMFNSSSIAFSRASSSSQRLWTTLLSASLFCNNSVLFCISVRC
uniref:Secreted protein n=1 Tax=Haemonchus placei TaxID=6290 RepID=A0A0N4WMT5_HAEPC